MNAEIAAMERSGVIVNNASVDGLRGYPLPGGAAYSAPPPPSTVSWMRSSGRRAGAAGPRTRGQRGPAACAWCAICPGWIDTPPKFMVA